MKKFLIALISLVVFASCSSKNECNCPDAVDNSSQYAEKLVGKWVNWDSEFWGKKTYTFRADKTGAESGYGIEENMTFKWNVEKHNTNYYIHVTDWNWYSDNPVGTHHIDNIYWHVEFMTDDIINLSGTGTEDATYNRVAQ